MLKALTRGILPLALFVVTAHGQTPQTKSPTFEVAAIAPAEPLDIAKLAASGNLSNLRIGANITETRADYSYLALTNLVQMAFKVQPYQMSAPAWMNEARFDIHATIPQGATREQVPDMLRALLVERFGMVARRESREMNVYSLVPGKDGAKLQPAEDTPAAPPAEPGKDDIVIGQGENQTRVTRGTGPNGANSATVTSGRTTMTMNMSPEGKIQMNISRMTIEELVALLTQMADRPVLDNTGLKGAYQMKLELAIADLANVARAAGLTQGAGGAGGGAAAGLPAGAAADPSGSSVFQMVQGLGLRLEPKRAPIDFVVVEKMEKTPTAN